MAIDSPMRGGSFRNVPRASWLIASVLLLVFSTGHAQQTPPVRADADKTAGETDPPPATTQPGESPSSQPATRPAKSATTRPAGLAAMVRSSTSRPSAPQRPPFAKPSPQPDATRSMYRLPRTARHSDDRFAPPRDLHRNRPPFWNLSLRNSDGSYDVLDIRSGHTLFGLANPDGTQDLFNPLRGDSLFGIDNGRGGVDYFNPRTGRWILDISQVDDSAPLRRTGVRRQRIAPRFIGTPPATVAPSTRGPARRAVKQRPARRTPARRAGGGR